MGQSVVVKKEEKLSKLFETYGHGITEDEFIELFKKDYLKDWDRINKVFLDEEKKTKPGKSHPMPEPTKYLENMYKVYVKKLGKGL